MDVMLKIEWYTPLALNCQKGQHLPTLEVYKNQSPIFCIGSMNSLSYCERPNICRARHPNNSLKQRNCSPNVSLGVSKVAQKGRSWVLVTFQAKPFHNKAVHNQILDFLGRGCVNCKMHRNPEKTSPKSSRKSAQKWEFCKKLKPRKN